MKREDLIRAAMGVKPYTDDTARLLLEELATGAQPAPEALAKLYAAFLPQPLTGRQVATLRNSTTRWLAAAIEPRHLTPSLRYVLADGEYRIATDGNRMHIWAGASRVDEPVWLSPNKHVPVDIGTVTPISWRSVYHASAAVHPVERLRVEHLTVIPAGRRVLLLTDTETGGQLLINEHYWQQATAVPDPLSVSAIEPGVKVGNVHIAAGPRRAVIMGMRGEIPADMRSKA